MYWEYLVIANPQQRLLNPSCIDSFAVILMPVLCTQQPYWAEPFYKSWIDQQKSQNNHVLTMKEVNHGNKFVCLIVSVSNNNKNVTELVWYSLDVISKFLFQMGCFPKKRLQARNLCWHCCFLLKTILLT